MQLEIYSLIALKDQISVSLEAICDSYSSLLWDIEFYQCGCFEVYIAASPQNVSIFQRGRIVARSDDAQHFGIIESLQLETDAEKGDYLTVTGRFLACLLERRIIYPTITANGSYEDIVRKVLSRNVISAGIRNLPGFSMGTVSGDCWQKTARMQVSYDNILEWLYSLCETIGGSANVRLDGNALKCDLFSGTDRSLLQDDNPHIVFSDAYNNLLSFSYAADDAVQKNFAYVLGCGEGSARKRTTFCSGAEPTYLDRYEVYVDERNTAQEVDDLTAGEIIATGQCGENIYYVLYDNGKLLLRGTGATYDYTSHDSVFDQNDQIKEIVLSNGITGLGDRLFYHCANAETVSLPATLTSIGDSAFAQEDAAIGYTAGLTSVTIPQAVTAIQSYAFYHTAIAEVTVPASVKTWGKYVFSNCTKLKNARISCDSIGSFAFTRCIALSSLTISANCRTFGENMLTYCESLKTITYEGTIAQWNAITKPVNWMSSGEHSYNNYLKKIQCVDGYLEYDPENNVWNEVKNG